MHLADIHEEAQQLGKDLLSEEYDDGNPGQLVERALDELGQKLAPGPPLDEYGRRAPTIRSLLHDMHHPFVLPFPVASGEATGRISVLLVELEKLANLAPPILQLETSGHETMVACNKKVQWRARLRTRTDPSVGLLRLEAVESLLLSGTPYAESHAKDERAALRVEVVRSAAGLITAAPGEFLSGGVKSGLRPIVEDVRQAAQLLVLDLRRRLYTVRSRLGVLQRFKARCEWHDRERLRRLADDAQQAKRFAEHVLRDELTRYLFDQGLNPLAEAALGASSRADVFDPSLGPSFYVEAKQYRDRAAVEPRLRAAFRQALDTVGNIPGSGYTIDEAFIVLFRRSGPRVLLPTEPFMAEGLRWHFVLINIAEASEDASQNTETPVEYSAESLREILIEVGVERSLPVPPRAHA